MAAVFKLCVLLLVCYVFRVDSYPSNRTSYKDKGYFLQSVNFVENYTQTKSLVHYVSAFVQTSLPDAGSDYTPSEDPTTVTYGHENLANRYSKNDTEDASGTGKLGMTSPLEIQAPDTIALLSSQTTTTGDVEYTTATDDQEVTSPEETEAPETTSLPSHTTDDPEYTTETDDPEVTSPEETEAPETTSLPAHTTDDPENTTETDDPEVTSPEETEAPETTSLPAHTTDDPEVTSPEETEAPETTSLPAHTTDDPEYTTETDDPEVTSPEETEATGTTSFHTTESSMILQTGDRVSNETRHYRYKK